MNEMMTKITQELKSLNINPAGCYASLPKIMSEAVIDSKLFGFEAWSNNSCLGSALKEIVKKYSIN